MIGVFRLVCTVLVLNPLVDEVNHVIDWSMTNGESHGSHVRVLPFEEVFIVGVGFYSSTNSVFSFNDLEFQVSKILFFLEMLDDESGI